MPIISKRQAIYQGIPRKHLHTVLVPREWGLQIAKEWIKAHDYKARHRTTTNFYRFNQVPEIIGAHFYTKILPNDVELVFQTY